ncbi:MAG: helix-turn-helix transcriptional regulator [Clostridia bacterium]|nr:helix-turn-helix transcriptional regulator [Clostridia bacterium]
MFKNVERAFHIDAMAYSFEATFPKNYAFDGESHDYIEIVYIQSGRAEVAENDKIYLLEGGNMIFHAPMEFHRIKSAEGTTPRIFNLSVIIKGTVPDSLYDGVFELDAGERAEYVSIFNAADRFICSKESSAGAAHQAAARLEAFILNICRRNNKSNNLSNEAGALVYKKLVRMMNERVRDNITLASLAADNYISISYVKSLFYRYAGTGPRGYYAKLQAYEAARLINGGTPIARVAEMMNFSSPNYFSLFFKKQMGQTPSEYKKNNSH